MLGLPPLDILSDAPVLLIILANGFIGASMGMIIFTSRDPRDPGAPVLRRARRRRRRARDHPPHHAAGDPLAALLHHVYQTLSLLVSFEYIWLITDGGPFFDTTVYALYVYQRAFGSGQYAYGAALALGLVVVGIAAALAHVALHGHAVRCCSGRGSRCSDGDDRAAARAGRLAGGRGRARGAAGSGPWRCSTPS